MTFPTLSSTTSGLGNAHTTVLRALRSFLGLECVSSSGHISSQNPPIVPSTVGQPRYVLSPVQCSASLKERAGGGSLVPEKVLMRVSKQCCPPPALASVLL